MNATLALCPAYAAEHYAFQEPIANPILQEVVPRVVALVVPIFYAAQSVGYTAVGALEFATTILQRTPGILCQYAAVHAGYSIRNLVSSILEIPEKLVFGSRHLANYLGDPGRYTRICLEEQIGLL